MKRLEKGKRLVEILKQPQYGPMPVEKEIIILYAAVNNHLIDIPVNKIKEFEKELFNYIDTHYRDIGKDILEHKQLTDELKSKLDKAINDFKNVFLSEI